MKLREVRPVLAGSAASVALLAAAATTAATYSGMRCGNELISKGDSSARVHAHCGEPRSRSQRREARTVRRSVAVPCRRGAAGERRSRRARCRVVDELTVEIVVEDWTYDFGAQRLVHTATFEDGRLREVRTEGYGSSSDER